MKKSILIFILSVFAVSCKAQIINIKNQGNYMRATQGQYYKDIDNLLNPYEGTWLFTEGNRELRIILVKKVNHNNGLYREDVIVGGYEYKVNGTTLVNTLDDINNFYLNSIQYNISGNSIMENDFSPPCNSCATGEKRLRLSFSDSETQSTVMGTLIVRAIQINGQDAIKVKLFGTTVYYEAGTTPPPDDFVLPSGEYTLIKQ